MANWITIIRTLLAFVVLGILTVKTQPAYIAAFGLTVLVILMDGLDGYVARKFNETSKAGSVIDILGDRIVEMAYWIGFLALGWVHMWVPLTVMTRGIVVDGLRSLALEQGYTAFGSTSMMTSSLGSLLVSSRLSRFLYGGFKVLAFCLMIIAFTPGLPGGVAGIIVPVAYASVYLTVFFCVIRGLPVILEAKRFLQQ